MDSIIAALESILAQLLTTETANRYEVDQLSAAATSILMAINVLENLQNPP